MTIYSEHPNRGKVQILATYQGLAGVTSATVTSINELSLATSVVEALNRVAACTAVPMCTYDERDGNFDRYPIEHLEALVEKDARASLLEGAHSLWYELVKAHLHQALADLDRATTGQPDPVRLAIATELQTEARQLQAAWGEYTTGQEHEEPQRLWEFSRPALVLETAVADLSDQTRLQLNRAETGTTAGRLRSAVDDLRLLTGVSYLCRDGNVRLDSEILTITRDVDSDDGLLLDIAAPRLGRYHTSAWTVGIHRWVPDSWDEDGEVDGATSEPIAEAELDSRPSAKEIAEILNLAEEDPGRLGAWATTASGNAFPGTRFVVNNQYPETATR